MGEYADEAIDQYFDYHYVRLKRAFKPKEHKQLLIRGKAKWAKILGEPVWGYENTFKHWTVDVYVDEATVERLKAEGLGEKIKDKGNGPFITFSRKEFKQDGKPNQPIRVVDHKGETWDKKKKIGNGSVVNVNFATNEYKKGKFSANILSLQVWEHVPYEGGEFPTREDGESADDWSQEVA